MNIRQPATSLQDSKQPGGAILKSVCRGCHGGCGVLLHVQDGVLLKVEGDRDSPLNHGRLCPIGTVTTDLVYHPDRLKYPMWRKGERSGHVQRVREIRLDCDADAILLRVESVGGVACHTGRRRCFFQRLEGEGAAARWVATDAVLESGTPHG